MAEQPQVMPPDEWAGVGEGDAASRRALDDGHYQRAEYDCECGRCGGDIYAGDPITPHGDEWVHPRCAA